MPASVKRSSQRSRRTTRHSSPSPPLQEQSSPSRPPKRRKKAPRSSDQADTVEEEEGSSFLTNDPNANDHDDTNYMTAVINSFKSRPVTAASQHSNTIHGAKTEDIEAYAKVAGSDWTYYITSLRVNIGRTSEGGNQPAAEEDYVHIDLGPEKTISRQTAVVYYNPDASQWYLKVNARNGLKVDESSLKRDDEDHALRSGEVIDVAGIEMMFVLPPNISPLSIDPLYLERAGISKPPKSSPARETRTSLPKAPPTEFSTPQAARPSSRSRPFQHNIAPAPPDYKRHGTPPPSRSRPTTSQLKSPAFDSTPSTHTNPVGVDLSKDENKNIKPAFSYAQMITQAIMETRDHKLNLNGIYNYILTNYAYYRAQPAAGWQNSIRHNLSLNKCFSKAPRSTDEPGKGMKWEIVPESKDEMFKSAFKGGRGGHRGSSAPSSPSQPNQLNYITQGPRDMAVREPGSTRKRKVSPTGSPPPSSLDPSQMTPIRKFPTTGPASFQDGSPLPRNRKAANASSSFGPSDSLPRSPPTLSSSYQPDESASFVTPAPLRVHPRLAPPSTAQRPSQHMPTSSPAPFWKYADLHSTPLKFDVSPSKPIGGGLPQSSSPPPAARSRSPVASPTRTPRGQTREASPDRGPSREEEGGFDLFKGFQSIGSYHAGGVSILASSGAAGRREQPNGATRH